MSNNGCNNEGRIHALFNDTLWPADAITVSYGEQEIGEKGFRLVVLRKTRNLVIFFWEGRESNRESLEKKSDAVWLDRFPVGTSFRCFVVRSPLAAFEVSRTCPVGTELNSLGVKTAWA
jgi:hypothetical protein